MNINHVLSNIQYIIVNTQIALYQYPAL